MNQNSSFYVADRLPSVRAYNTGQHLQDGVCESLACLTIGKLESRYS